jgi:hypothetical protein
MESEAKDVLPFTRNARRLPGVTSSIEMRLATGESRQKTNSLKEVGTLQ